MAIDDGIILITTYMYKVIDYIIVTCNNRFPTQSSQSSPCPTTQWLSNYHMTIVNLDFIEG